MEQKLVSPIDSATTCEEVALCVIRDYEQDSEKPSAFGNEGYGDRYTGPTKAQTDLFIGLAKGANCAGCIGCSAKNPGRINPLTEIYSDAISTTEAGRTLPEVKVTLASRLPADRVVNVDQPEDTRPVQSIAA